MLEVMRPLSGLEKGCSMACLGAAEWHFELSSAFKFDVEAGMTVVIGRRERVWDVTIVTPEVQVKPDGIQSSGSIQSDLAIASLC